jgi:hypothetical protein
MKKEDLGKISLQEPLVELSTPLCSVYNSELANFVQACFDRYLQNDWGTPSEDHKDR